VQSLDLWTASGFFARGSTADAIFALQQLTRRAARIRVATARVRVLVHLAALARSLEHRCSALLAPDAPPAPLLGPVLAALGAALPRRSAEPAECLLEALAALPAAHAPRRAAQLADLAVGLVRRPPEGDLLLALSMNLCAGRRDDAHRRVEALLPGRERERARELLATGVLVRAGNRAGERFIASLDGPADALAYRPSLPLLRALCALGAPARREAAAVLAALTKDRRTPAQEARALWAASSYPERPLSEALALLAAIRSPALRRRGFLHLVRAALAGGRLDDAELLAARAPGQRAQAEARLAIAAALGARGHRTAARRCLHAVRDPALAVQVALLRAQLDLDGGLALRAARRLRALPRLLDPRRAPPPSPRLPGEDVLEEPAAMAWRLRLEAWLAVGAPDRDSLRPHPHEVAALCREPDRIAALFRRPRLRALAATHLAPLAPRHLGALLTAELDALALVARAQAVLASASASASASALASASASAPITPEQAYLLGLLGVPLPGDARRDPRLADALAPARAAYDEGTALGPARDRRRAVLLDVARASLRRLLSDPATGIAASAGEATRQVLRSRVRCLVHLGGEPAAAALHRLLSTAADNAAAAARTTPTAPPIPERRTLFAALAELSPPRALDLFVHHHEPITAHGRDLAWTAELLASSGALAPASAAALPSLYTRLRARFGEPASAWLGAYLRAFVRAAGALPGPDALDAIAPPIAPSAPFPATGEEHVDALLARRDALLARAPDAFVRALDQDPELLGVLRALQPARCGGDLPAWPEVRYREVLRRLQVDIGLVAAGPLRLLRAALPRGAAPVAALCRGEPPTPALSRAVPLGAGHALRWLDKRRDFLAFFRFADCVPCCFNSSSRYYRPGSMDTQRMVLSLWKDPLSFCFQIVRLGEGGAESPRGFVFGSFGLAGGHAAAVLNGVYLQRQTSRLREAVVTAVERELCLPLGIRQVAIAACHGGAGPLPAGYGSAPRRVIRLRALLDLDGALVWKIYDDFSSQVNEEISTGYGVRWRDLEELPALSTPGVSAGTSPAEIPNPALAPAS